MVTLYSVFSQLVLTNISFGQYVLIWATRTHFCQSHSACHNREIDNTQRTRRPPLIKSMRGEYDVFFCLFVCLIACLFVCLFFVFVFVLFCFFLLFFVCLFVLGFLLVSILKNVVSIFFLKNVILFAILHDGFMAIFIFLNLNPKNHEY